MSGYVSNRTTFDRKFDVWAWRDDREAMVAKGVKPGGYCSYEYEVRVTRHENVAIGKVEYYIVSDEPGPIKVRANDLEQLRVKLDAAIRAFLAVEWKPFLVVEVTRGDRFDSSATSARLYMNVREAQEGRSSHNADLVWHRFLGKDSLYNDTSVHAGKIPLSDRDGEPYRVVPDTPANRAALEAVRLGIKALGEKLDGLLSAEKIQDTLANVRVDRLLSVKP
jgi:hypothetical protein